MAEKQKTAEEQLQAVQAELVIAKAYGNLTDAEKSHCSGMEGKELAKFLDMDAEGRKSSMSEADEDNPVVYKNDEGTEFRKNDDPRTVEYAQRADKALRIAKAERKLRRDAELSKRAEAELGNLPGDAEVKKALLDVVGDVKDEATRKGIAEILAAANGKLAKAFDRSGAGTKDAENGEDELEKLAKTFMSNPEFIEKQKRLNRPVSLAEARSEVISTPEGYAAIQKMEQETR